MSNQKITVWIEKKNLIVSVPLAPRPSSTGKSTIIASTSGWADTPTQYQGKPITLSLNAIIK